MSSSSRAPTHHDVSANGLVHHVLAWEADAPPVSDAARAATCVLVHGYMDAAGTWDLVAPRLAGAGLRVLAPDMRGFGAAPRAPAGSYYHFPDYVADLDGIIDAMLAPDEPLFLVGHSMGGTIATLYAGARPSRVAKLANLEGLGPPDHPHDLAADRMTKWLDDLRVSRGRASRAATTPPTLTREDALRKLVGNHPRVDVEILRSRIAHLTKETEEGRVAWRFDPLHKTTAPVPFFTRTFVAFARRVTCPALFVSGGPLGWHPPDEEERLAAFAHLARVELASAGHMMHWTAPGAVSDALLAFWK